MRKIALPQGTDLEPQRTGSEMFCCDKRHKYETLTDAIVDIKRRYTFARKQFGMRGPPSIYGPLRFLGSNDYRKMGEGFDELAELIGENPKALAARMQDFYIDIQKIRHLQELYNFSCSIHAIDKEGKFRNAYLTVMAESVDHPLIPIREIARASVINNLLSIPLEAQTRLLNEWALSGLSLEGIARHFDKETSGKLAQIDHPFTADNLSPLSQLPYEVALVNVLGRRFLIRGDYNSVLYPQGAKPLFHTHPASDINSVLPSEPNIYRIRGDFQYDIEKGEYGFIVSRKGITLHSGADWSRDSYEPFKRLLLSKMQDSVHYVAGVLSFHANYATRIIPICFFSWEALRNGPHLPPTLPPANGTTETSSLLIGIKERVGLTSRNIVRMMGNTLHPDPQYGNSVTGSYLIEVAK